MSEYKKGDKVLAEADIIGIGGTAENTEYQLKPETVCVSFWMTEGKIHPMPAKDATKEDGMNEAWEMARKIVSSEADGGYSGGELIEIFGAEGACNGSDVILRKFTATEAAAKIKAWEAAQRICVGDVVQKKSVASDARNGVVVKTYKNLRWVIWEFGDIGDYDVDELKKTGRTIDIANLLKQIGGEES